MASPWIVPTQQRQHHAERPWMGLAMLLAIPLLSLVLIRMLWSGSTLWYLMIGLVLVGASAVVLLARRNADPYAPTSTPAPSNRGPMILGGIGALLLALLVVPNFSKSTTAPALETQQRSAPTAITSQVSGVSQAPVRPTAVQQLQPQVQPTAVPQVSQQVSPQTEPQTDNSASTGGETYAVQDGDTLWDIAEQHDTTVEAIIAANNLENENDLHIGQELTIPASQ